MSSAIRKFDLSKILSLVIAICIAALITYFVATNITWDGNKSGGWGYGLAGIVTIFSFLLSGVFSYMIISNTISGISYIIDIKKNKTG